MRSKLLTLAAMTASFTLAQTQGPSLTVDGLPRRMSVKAGETASFAALLQLAEGSARGRESAIQIDLDLKGSPSDVLVRLQGPAVHRIRPGEPETIPIEVRARTAGEYPLRLQATVLGTRETTTVDTVISVRPGLKLNRLVALPAAIPVGESANVRFIVVADGDDRPRVVTVQSAAAVAAQLTDDGGGADTEAGDGVFAGWATVATRGMTAGQCVEYFASADGVRSASSKVCATGLPTTISEPDSTHVFEAEGRKVLGGEIAVVFRPGTSEAAMMASARSLGGTIAGAMPEIETYQIRFSPPPRTYEDLMAKVRQAQALGNVEEAGPHGFSQPHVGFTPNDEYFPNQWGHVQTRVPEAWVVGRGKGQVVGVADTGVRYAHDDLAGQVIKGYDYVANDSDPYDEHGHGTHVAGIVAAKGNNGIGVAGVAFGARVFTPRALSGFKQKGDNNWNCSRALLQAMEYGTRVINASFGSEDSQYHCRTARKIAEAGFLLVAAAGNSNSSTAPFPAGCANGVIAVGSLLQNGKKRSTSNFGSWVDLAAPGTDIWSVLPVNGGCLNCDPLGYGKMSGTSMASPMVAGTLALMLSRNPALGRGELTQRLLDSTAPLDAETKPFFRNGRLDTFEAAFNGSFETGFDWWSLQGVALWLEKVGAVKPTSGSRMAALSIIPGNALIGKQATLSQKFDFPQERNQVKARVLVSMLIPPSAPGAPGPKLHVIAVRDGVSKTVAVVDNLVQMDIGVNSFKWTVWKTVDIPIDKCDKAEIRFVLNDSGTGQPAYALIDSVSFL